MYLARFPDSSEHSSKHCSSETTRIIENYQLIEHFFFEYLMKLIIKILFFIPVFKSFLVAISAEKTGPHCSKCYLKRKKHH